MLTGIRHKVVVLLACMPLALAAACGGSQPLPEDMKIAIDATVQARIDPPKKAAVEIEPNTKPIHSGDKRIKELEAINATVETRLAAIIEAMVALHFAEEKIATLQDELESANQPIRLLLKEHLPNYPAPGWRGWSGQS